MSTEKKALLLVGGWEGHEPELVAKRFSAFLEEQGFTVRIERDLEILQDREYLFSLDLFVPIWTMGELHSKLTNHLADAIGSGVGVAGCHGGMCDAFRTNVLWQFINIRHRLDRLFDVPFLLCLWCFCFRFTSNKFKPVADYFSSPVFDAIFVIILANLDFTFN